MRVVYFALCGEAGGFPEQHEWLVLSPACSTPSGARRRSSRRECRRYRLAIVCTPLPSSFCATTCSATLFASSKRFKAMYAEQDSDMQMHPWDPSAWPDSRNRPPFHVVPAGVRQRAIVVRNGVTRIRLPPVRIYGHSSFHIPGNFVVVVGLNVEFLPLAGPVAQFIGFFESLTPSVRRVVLMLTTPKVAYAIASLGSSSTARFKWAMAAWSFVFRCSAWPRLKACKASREEVVAFSEGLGELLH